MKIGAWAIRASIAMACVVMSTPPALAQGPVATRPGAATVAGDTGLWFLPIGEILPDGQFSVSGHRENADFNPGSSDITHLSLSGAVGIGSHVELFGAWHARTEIARDGVPVNGTTPLFHDGPGGGIVAEYPFANRAFTRARGDLIAGGKWRFLSQIDQRPVALTIRPWMKVPIGDDDAGVSTGSAAYAIDVIVSSEKLRHRVEFAAVAGAIFRTDADGIDLPHSVRWGGGVRWPTRSGHSGPAKKFVSAIAELHGERYSFNSVDISRGSVGALLVPGAPRQNPQENPVNLLVGAIWQSPSGWFVRAGVQFNMNQPSVIAGSKRGLEISIGRHRGVGYHQIPKQQDPPTMPAVLREPEQ